MSEIIKNEKKVAIVLFNLGGPDSLKAVKFFLFNLFNDKHIVTVPKILRFFIAKFIANRREKFAQEIYSHTGNKSPILARTIAQKEALKKYLIENVETDNLKFEIFICMRHWHPMTDEVVKNIEDYDPTEVIMIPLYPQFSTTTTFSSIEEFTKKLKNKDKIKLKTICCYPTDENFINASVGMIEKTLSDKKDLKNFRMLFSAHGLPEKIIKNGDPYQWQIEQTVEKIVKQLVLIEKFKNIDYKITYQSKVGPLKWLSPNTEDEITLACKQKKSLIIIPIAFVSENVETLVELDIEYKKIADIHGIEYIRILTLGTDKTFIKSLAIMVSKLVNQDGNLLTSSKFSRICPNIFNKCPCSVIASP